MPSRVVRSWALSIVVIGLNHRTVPLELLERTTVTADALPKALARSGRPAEHQRGRGAVDVQPHRGLRRRRAFPCRLRRTSATSCATSPTSRPRTCSRTSTASSTTTPPSPTCSRWPPGSTPPCSASTRSSARCARAWERGAARGRGTGRPQPALPPRPRGRQAGPHRDRHRPLDRIGVHAAVEMATERLGSLAGRRVLVVGAGEMGEGMVVALSRAGLGEVLVANRTSGGPSSWPHRVGGRAVALLDVERRPGRRRRAAHLHRRGLGRDRRRRRREADGAPRRPAAAGRRRGRAPRRRRRRRRDSRASRCSTSTTCAPSPSAAWPSARAEAAAGPAASSPRRSSATPRWPPPARRRRSWPQLHERAEGVRQAELERFRSKLAGLDDAAAGRGGSPHPGPRRQAAARADGPASRRRRHAARRAQRRGRPRPVRSALTVLLRHVQAGGRDADRLRLATRGSPWPAGRPSTCRPPAGRHPASPSSSWWWRPRATRATDAPIQRHRRPGRVRQGGAAGGARRSRRRRRALGQGPALRPPPAGLVMAAVPERGDARDALVGSTLAGLAPGATVATGLVRRRAQLAALRPDLAFVDLRGNIDTRLDQGAGGWRHRGGRQPPSSGWGSPTSIAEVLAARRDGAPGRPGRARRRVPRRRPSGTWAWSQASSTAPAGRGRPRAGLPGRRSAAVATCPSGAHASVDDDDARPPLVPGRSGRRVAGHLRGARRSDRYGSGEARRAVTPPGSRLAAPGSRRSAARPATPAGPPRPEPSPDACRRGDRGDRRAAAAARSATPASTTARRQRPGGALGRRPPDVPRGRRRRRRGASSPRQAGVRSWPASRAAIPRRRRCSSWATPTSCRCRRPAGDRDPFGGELVDGEIWGRGAIDMLNLTASMAVATKHLAAPGVAAERHARLPRRGRRGGRRRARRRVAGASTHWDAVACRLRDHRVRRLDHARAAGRQVVLTVGEKGVGVAAAARARHAGPWLDALRRRQRAREGGRGGAPARRPTARRPRSTTCGGPTRPSLDLPAEVRAALVDPADAWTPRCRRSPTSAPPSSPTPAPTPRSRPNMVHGGVEDQRDPRRGRARRRHPHPARPDRRGRRPAAGRRPRPPRRPRHGRAPSTTGRARRARSTRRCGTPSSALVAQRPAGSHPAAPHHRRRHRRHVLPRQGQRGVRVRAPVAPRQLRGLLQPLPRQQRAHRRRVPPAHDAVLAGSVPFLPWVPGTTARVVDPDGRPLSGRSVVVARAAEQASASSSACRRAAPRWSRCPPSPSPIRPTAAPPSLGRGSAGGDGLGGADVDQRRRRLAWAPSRRPAGPARPGRRRPRHGGGLRPPWG